jgi:hypothetical protein
MKTNSCKNLSAWGSIAVLASSPARSGLHEWLEEGGQLCKQQPVLDTLRGVGRGRLAQLAQHPAEVGVQLLAALPEHLVIEFRRREKRRDDARLLGERRGIFRGRDGRVLQLRVELQQRAEANGCLANGGRGGIASRSGCRLRCRVHKEPRELDDVVHVPVAFALLEPLDTQCRVLVSERCSNNRMLVGVLVAVAMLVCVLVAVAMLVRVTRVLVCVLVAVLVAVLVCVLVAVLVGVASTLVCMLVAMLVCMLVGVTRMLVCMLVGVTRTLVCMLVCMLVGVLVGVTRVLVCVLVGVTRVLVRVLVGITRVLVGVFARTCAPRKRRVAARGGTLALPGKCGVSRGDLCGGGRGGHQEAFWLARVS